MNSTTLVFLVLISVFYCAAVLRRAIRTKIDLFDAMFLLTVVLVPCLFALFEEPFTRLTHALGVTYPFVLIFAFVHGCTFLYFGYLASRLNELRLRETRLIQEISLLKEKVDGLSRPAGENRD